MPKYPSIPVVQRITTDGSVKPKAPAGMAVPVGYELSHDGMEYIKQPRLA